MTLTVAGTFSGILGLERGCELAGMRTLWHAEIEKFPNRVIAKRSPDAPNFGDITRIGADAPRPDVLVGGFPCQDLSVAGKRAGLAGARSGLFYEFLRLADLLAPDWLLIENVPGLLSSGTCPECKAADKRLPGHDHSGADFAVLLGELTGFEPEVPEGGWRTGGICVGPKRAAAWRVLDSRHFGVAQRRRRVFSLSPRAATGILRRAARRGRTLPARLQAALEALAAADTATTTSASRSGQASEEPMTPTEAHTSPTSEPR